MSRQIFAKDEWTKNQSGKVYHSLVIKRNHEFGALINGRPKHPYSKIVKDVVAYAVVVKFK